VGGKVTGLPGPKKLKRPNLAISSFKKGQILKNEKKAFYFWQTVSKRPNGNPESQ